MTLPLILQALDVLDADHAAAIAGLPASLRLSDGDTPDIVIVPPEAAAIAAGLAHRPRGLVVTRPGALNGAAADMLEGADCPVFPALALAPRLDDPDGKARLAGAGLVRSHLAWGGHRAEGLIEHLAALEMLLGPLSDIQLLLANVENHAGSARTESGVLVSWSGEARSAAPAFELDIIGAASRIEIAGPLDGSARPLTVCRAGAEGLTQAHGRYETGQRLFWRRVLEAMKESRPSGRWREFYRLHQALRPLRETSTALDGALP